MDLIAQAIAAVLAFFFGIIGNIFAHDICASVNSICAKIIKAAAARLTPFDRNPTEQEWLAGLQEHQTVTEKYRHAVGCFLAAPKMRRYALEAPFVREAPGLVWRQRREKVWEARWQSSLRAREEGFVVKSVKLWSGHSGLTSQEREFIVDVTLKLQGEQDQWMRDNKCPNGRHD